MRWCVLIALVACSAPGTPPAPAAPTPPPTFEASLPSTPGQFAPSLMALAGTGDVNGDELSDVDTCATCHADIANQWCASAHSFASFNNPIYRENVELARTTLGNEDSQHCGGCHDASLEIDGTMLGEVPADDLRAHSGVTCRLCHGVDSVSNDGNGSYVLSRASIPTPNLDDPASIEMHKTAATVKPIGAELCVGCHRGFLSPDIDVPAHVSGLDEPTFWRSSAYTGNGVGRVDKVDQKTCIDCHMAAEPVGPDEVAAHDGVVSSHRFVGGHTWMAAMRGDQDQLARTQAMLKGVASIDIAAARDARGAWTLPADGAPVAAGTRMSVDVVVRNLLVGHRFPGGVNDVQDTWIEIEVSDARGHRVASSGLAHEKDAHDTEAHVLRSYPVDENGNLLDEHEMPSFRGVIANQTIAARDAIAVRYAFDVPVAVSLPLTVDARLRHRSRSLAFQETVCAASKTKAGVAFHDGTKAARDADLEPCRAEPITEIASTRVILGGTPAPATRPAWSRLYELGMALVPVIGERLDEPKTVLEAALALAPDAKAKGAVLAQLAMVAGKQGRTDDALALVEQARALILSVAPKAPPVLDYTAADACARVWRWQEAAQYAEATTTAAPLNTLAWVMLARARGSLGDNVGALAAARSGLALTPRDPDLLRSQATALAALGSLRARARGRAHARDALASPGAAVRHRRLGRRARGDRAAARARSDEGR